MVLFRKLSAIICVILIANSVICAPSDSDKEDAKQKDESDSSESESDEKDLGTISPTEMEKLKEDIIEKQEEDAENFGLPLTNSPEEIDKFLEKEEEEQGKELPEEIEKLLTDDGKFDKFAHFLELFDKISSKAASENKKEEITEPKSPEEMEKMKEELFDLWNKESEKTGEGKLSQEEFDEIWEKMNKEHDKEFPNYVNLMIVQLKKLEEKEESGTSEKASEEETEIPTSVTESSEELVVPEDTFILRNGKGKVCILAKFHSMITITYPGKLPEQKVEVHVPYSAHVQGKCGGSNRSPQLQMSWEKFVFTFFFDKVSEESWGVTEIELSYDEKSLFDDATTDEKVIAKSKKGDNYFITPLGKSYVCPSKETILLYGENQHVTTVRIKEVHLQPYDVEDGKFSASHHCNQVVLDALDQEPFVQDETIPLAVGCTLALITLLILVGFSVHRAYQAAKVDYNEMP